MTDQPAVERTLRPGDEMHFINETGKALQIKVVMACGTEAVCDLPPSARFDMTVGTHDASVYIVRSAP
jgi:hypothetical protein